MKKTKNLPCVALTTLWCAALFLPLATRCLLVPAGIVSYAPFNAQGENRPPAPRPSARRGSPRHVAWKDLGRGLEAWYNDSFPWRTELLHFHGKVSFSWLKTPVGREVPGRGNWVFRRGGNWAELDDYLGAFELTDDELSDWLAVFEGRREWARALGTVFLTVPAPVKAQVCWQEMYPALRKHRGRNVAMQVREALADSPARDDVLFLNPAFEAARAAGRDVFFDADHHPNAYGVWLLYDGINHRLAELFPNRVRAPFPWYDSPPPEVRSGQTPGCWPDGDGALADARLGVRLAVSSPSETVANLDEPERPKGHPYCDIVVERAGGGLSILMAHDSYMRFTLASWRGRRADVRLPFAEGVGHVRALIFKRFTTSYLENAIQSAIPDVIIEQFPECRLDHAVKDYLNPTIRAAAVFGRGSAPPPGRLPRAGDRVAVRVVFESVHSPKDGALSALLLWNGREIERRKVLPGVRRAVFFDIAVPSDGLPSASGLAVALEGGAASSTNLAWRLVGPLSQRMPSPSGI